MRIEEFEAEKQWWNHREETELAWQVSMEDINPLLSLSEPRSKKSGVEINA